MFKMSGLFRVVQVSSKILQNMPEGDQASRYHTRVGRLAEYLQTNHGKNRVICKSATSSADTSEMTTNRSIMITKKGCRYSLIVNKSTSKIICVP